MASCVTFCHRVNCSLNWLIINVIKRTQMLWPWDEEGRGTHDILTIVLAAEIARKIKRERPNVR